MDKYKVKKLEGNTDIIVEVPGSKSITNRALLLAALGQGKTRLKGTLFSDDSRHFLSSLVSLGFEAEINEASREVTVQGCGGRIPKSEAEVYVGSAGTAARFITAMLGLSGGKYKINSSEQMKKRPMKPLFLALEKLGAKIIYEEREYHLPVTILGREKNDVCEIELDTDESTQYLSAMLMAGVMCENGLFIHVTGSRKIGSYVNITKKMMSEFGYEGMSYENDTYHIEANGCYVPDDSFEYQIEPDVSAACYFYGIAAITGRKVIVKNVHFDSTQGDINFVRCLEKMGCKVADEEAGISVTGPSGGDKLKGITTDMKNFSDQALTMAVVSLFAEGPTTIENIGHIRKQECDRLKAISENLGRMGIKTDEQEKSITIYPGEIKEADIETFDDHRVAMSFTLAGIMNGKIKIINPMCCRKTFENFFEVLEGIY